MARSGVDEHKFIQKIVCSKDDKNKIFAVAHNVADENIVKYI